ncbi:amidohydrolase [Maricurvus nonylphenolicus]|uniref:amidohydrolase n=1 Tax=Maricurvus nonylphenolicus TaxID=1008307 RepID=UPI0036F3376D
MRFKIIITVCLLGLLGCSLDNRDQITVYTAKTIVTLDQDSREVQAIAIQNDRIIAIGDLDSVKANLGDKPFVQDDQFANKVLIPGLINQHEHPALAALTMATHIIAIEDWEIGDRFYPRAIDADDYQQKLKALVAKHGEDDEMFYSWGYHRLWHGELSRADLDRISATVPMMVWQRSGHEFIFNSKALEFLDINQTMVDGFSDSAKAQTDYARGHFWEQGAMMLLPVLFKDMASPFRYIASLKDVRDYWHAAGSTHVVEPGGLTHAYLQKMHNFVFASDDNPYHMDYIPDGKSMAYEHIDGDMLGETEKVLEWGDGMSRFYPKKIKLFADGAIFSQLMQMKDGYLDGHHGEWIMNPDLLEKAFAAYWDDGYQIHVHQNGDAGLDLVLDIVEANLKRNPREDHRTVIVHFGFSTKEQVQRIKELGIIVSANPYYTVALADTYSEVGIGPERAQEMVRLGDLARAGVSFSLHADMPMAPGKPLFLVWSAVNRSTLNNNIAGPEQRITPVQALRAVTIEAAYSMQLEQDFGSLEVGKFANITVLDDNPLTVDPMTIKDIGIWGTIHEGRVLPAPY